MRNEPIVCKYGAPPRRFPHFKGTIIFDLGGVLINLDIARCINNLTQLLGENNLKNIMGISNDEEGTNAVSVANRQLMKDYEKGLISTNDFFSQVLPYCRQGTTQEQLEEAWRSMIVDLPEYRLQAIERLRQNGFSIYLLSNSNDSHWNYITEKFGFEKYFDRIFASHLLHLSKPNDRIFKLVDSEIGPWQRQHIYYIDDMLANREAAQQTVGCYTYASLEDFVKETQLTYL